MNPTDTPTELPSVSIVAPTYREAMNLPDLLERIQQVKDTHQLDLELIIMDDQSQDGSMEVVQQFGAPWAIFIERMPPRDLSMAVMDGFEAAANEMVIVIDADLSHPPELIPDMLNALKEGADMVIGSRYVQGGSTDAAWGFFRAINSKVATWLARPFTKIQDPMAGFFGMPRKDFFEPKAPYNPIGYKIGLEIIVKAQRKNIVELPIHFMDRTKGKSKMTFRENWRYLRHVQRLLFYKMGLRKF